MSKFTLDASGAQSIGEGAGSIFKALAMAPTMRAQAEQKAGLQNAQTYVANMQGNKAGMEAQNVADLLGARVRQRETYENDPNLTPYQRFAVGITNLVGPGHVNDFMSGTKSAMQMQNTQEVMADPSRALPVAQGYAATSGKMPFAHVGNTGYSVNELNGAQIEASPAIAKIFQAVEGAKANSQNASAANSYASANLHRAQTDKVRADVANGQQNGKPLPTAALKMQMDDLDSIALLGSINADLGAIMGQLDSGKLTLGPYSNLSNRLQNFTGVSDEGSRNYASLVATLEKQRNDSLRLNKGVQTEGDAQRAWNELFANMNDAGVVKQRLSEIQSINKRAAQFKQNNIDLVRRNFGAPALDTSAYSNVSPALGNAGARKVVRRGTQDGRAVVQYADGTVEFAQ